MSPQSYPAKAREGEQQAGASYQTCAGGSGGPNVDDGSRGACWDTARRGVPEKVAHGGRRGCLHVVERSESEVPVLVRRTQIDHAILDFDHPVRFGSQIPAEMGRFCAQTKATGQF